MPWSPMFSFKERERQKVSCHPQKAFAKEQNPIKTFHHCEQQKKYGSMLTLHCCSIWRGKELEIHFCLYSHYFFRESAEINSFDLWLMYGFITCDEAFGRKLNNNGHASCLTPWDMDKIVEICWNQGFWFMIDLWIQIQNVRKWNNIDQWAVFWEFDSVGPGQNSGTVLDTRVWQSQRWTERVLRHRATLTSFKTGNERSVRHWSFNKRFPSHREHHHTRNC